MAMSADFHKNGSDDSFVPRVTEFSDFASLRIVSVEAPQQQVCFYFSSIEEVRQFATELLISANTRKGE